MDFLFHLQKSQTKQYRTDDDPKIASNRFDSQEKAIEHHSALLVACVKNFMSNNPPGFMSFQANITVFY